MFRQLSLLTIYFFIISCCKAQLSISLQDLPAGIVQKQQLWNITTIYTGNTPINITISLTLIDLNDNQPVLTAFSKPIALSGGIRQLRAIDVSPVNYNYFSPAFSRLSEAFLPIGNYRACYVVYNGTKLSEDAMSEDCMNIEVNPLSPPQLTMPEDSAKLKDRNPQFSWLPPAPIILFSDLNYDLTITEVRNDQTSGTALQENIPIYNARRLTSVSNKYPVSAKALDTGKVYAWRVIAKNGEAFAAMSEVWTFKVVPEISVSKVSAAALYLELKSDQGITNTGLINDRNLGIKYYSYDAPHETFIKFYNDQGQLIKEVKRSIQYGNNFLAIELDQSFKEGATYQVEIKDLNLDSYKTSFRIIK